VGAGGIGMQKLASACFQQMPYSCFRFVFA